MKIRTLISILILVLAVQMVIGSCATQKNATEREIFKPINNNELVDVWVNTDYSGGMMDRQKTVVISYGYFKAFSSVDSKDPVETGTLFVVDKWTDSDGNIWYKAIWRERWSGNAFYYELDKISDDGNTWEWMYSRAEDFPSESDL